MAERHRIKLVIANTGWMGIRVTMARRESRVLH
jgi:hypothetical protein